MKAVYYYRALEIDITQNYLYYGRDGILAIYNRTMKSYITQKQDLFS